MLTLFQKRPRLRVEAMWSGLVCCLHAFTLLGTQTPAVLNISVAKGTLTPPAAPQPAILDCLGAYLGTVLFLTNCRLLDRLY